jgi:hypothetical protein
MVAHGIEAVTGGALTFPFAAYGLLHAKYAGYGACTSVGADI